MSLDSGLHRYDRMEEISHRDFYVRIDDSVAENQSTIYSASANDPRLAQDFLDYVAREFSVHVGGRSYGSKRTRSFLKEICVRRAYDLQQNGLWTPEDLVVDVFYETLGLCYAENDDIDTARGLFEHVTGDSLDVVRLQDSKDRWMSTNRGVDFEAAHLKAQAELREKIGKLLGSSEEVWKPPEYTQSEEYKDGTNG